MIAKRYVIFAMLLFAVSGSSAQLLEINAQAGYSLPIGKRFGVTDAQGIGGGTELVYAISDNLRWSVGFGYQQYAIDQDDETNKWGWEIWNRRYRNWVNIYLSDTATYAGSVTAVQSMEVLPVTLSAILDLPLTEELFLRTSLGGGVSFYTRKLHHEERWIKKFPSDNHRFEYTFHNFAPSKTGHPVTAHLAVGAVWRVSRIIHLNGTVRYGLTISTPGEWGYDQYPFNGTATIGGGISFRY